MKDYYYYIRDREGRPVITICLLKERNYYNLAQYEYARGIAFCSDKDAPCKKVGRKIALQRAEHAFKKKADSCEIKREELFFQLYYRQDGIVERNKSVYNPKLTNHEKKILFPRKK